MTPYGALDPLVFGQRLRHLRRSRGMTLEMLGRAISRPPSYLSQLENGHREPKLSMVNLLAAGLGCQPADLLEPEPPSRRAELEVALARIQEDARYQELHLPYLRPGAKLGTAAMEHLVALFGRVKELSAVSPGVGAGVPGMLGGHCLPESPRPPAPGAADDRTGAAMHPSGMGGPVSPLQAWRAANTTVRSEMRQRDNYYREIEQVASRALRAAGYSGPGAVSEHHLTGVAKYFGFEVERVQDLPPSTRSISDLRNHVVYVPQRNAVGGMRSSRSVVAQTLGHFALGHRIPQDYESQVRQRVEVNYFAGALLAPEAAFLRVLGEAKARQDISVEDASQTFYISYEMAAHRLTNLMTRHFGIPVHFQRCDAEGRLWKAYENDGVLLPAAADGTIEGQRLCRRWSSRQAFEAEDAYALHYQYTQTATGSFFCVTHIDLARNDGDAVTVGTVEAQAHWFRGSETNRRAVSTCPDPSCCRRPDPEAVTRWHSEAWPAGREQSRGGLCWLSETPVVFEPHSGVELTDVYRFLDRHSPGNRPARPAAARSPEAR